MRSFSRFPAKSGEQTEGELRETMDRQSGVGRMLVMYGVIVLLTAGGVRQTASAMSYAEFVKLELGREVAQDAETYVGAPYVWGGQDPRGFDCSGFTQYVFARHGIKVPRNSYEQFAVGINVPRTDLEPGDLVFFSTYAPGPSHLGIYIGNGKFVHALNNRTGVTMSKLDADYYRERFLGAKRVL
jgi:hypothetical protein